MGVFVCGQPTLLLINSLPNQFTWLHVKEACFQQRRKWPNRCQESVGRRTKHWAGVHAKRFSEISTRFLTRNRTDTAFERWATGKRLLNGFCNISFVRTPQHRSRDLPTDSWQTAKKYDRNSSQQIYVVALASPTIMFKKTDGYVAHGTKSGIDWKTLRMNYCSLLAYNFKVLL